MSKRNDRHEAERLARRAAYLNRLTQPSQTQKLLEAAAPINRIADSTLEPLPEAAQTPAVAEQAAGPKQASPAQYAANNANAQRSTGPVTLEGKAISSRNHTSHGLTATVAASGALSQGFKVLASENQAAYDARLAAYLQEWAPETATEIDLVARMATHSWLRERARRLQDASLEQAWDETQKLKQFEVFGRYYSLHLRAFNKALADLIRLKSFQLRQQKEAALAETRAQATQIRFESQKRKAETHAAKMETVRLKQEAQKLRNNRLKPVQTNPTTTAPAPEIDALQQAA